MSHVRENSGTPKDTYASMSEPERAMLLKRAREIIVLYQEPDSTSMKNTDMICWMNRMSKVGQLGVDYEAKTWTVKFNGAIETYPIGHMRVLASGEAGIICVVDSSDRKYEPPVPMSNQDGYLYPEFI